MMSKKITFLLTLMAFFVTGAWAQNVTISPSTGHLISAITTDDEIGAINGWGSMWRHNQLPLTLIVSDTTTLSNDHVLQEAAGDIILDPDQNLFVLGGGGSMSVSNNRTRTVTTHMSISLPRGYRITGYRIEMLNNMNNKGSYHGLTLKDQNMRFDEYDSTFSTRLAALDQAMGANSSSDSHTYVLQRTSRSLDDMGNNLYFTFAHSSDGYYAVTIKSIEIYFTAQGSFTIDMHPSASEVSNNPKNLYLIPFNTGKLDIGEVKRQTGSRTVNNQSVSYDFFGYDYSKVKDLQANMWLYQSDAVTKGDLPATAGNGNIYAQNIGNGSGQSTPYYTITKNGDYYLEAPVKTTDSQDNTIPLGYRITGARVNALEIVVSKALTDGFYISYTNNGTKYYLNTSLNFTTTPTQWTVEVASEDNGTYYIKSGNTYLYDSGSGFNHTLSTTTRKNSADEFHLARDGNGNYYFYYLTTILKTYEYISFSNRNRGVFADGSSSNIPTNAATIDRETVDGNCTITLYGTSKDTPVQTLKLDDTTGSGTLTASDLNNDAVKFNVSGLADGAMVSFTFSVDVEALNPFVRSFDVVAHPKDDQLQSVRETFETGDFMAGGGKLNLHVPQGFDDNDKVRLSFEKLDSRYATPDYGTGDFASLNARPFFVQSEYYKQYGDYNQYQATGNEDPITKTSTDEAGNKAFKFNNAEDLDRNSSSTTQTSLQETPFSMAEYKNQGGSFSEDNATATIGQDNKMYLVVGDETRYNIAPTTALEHRYYAFYSLEADVAVRTYTAKATLKKVYNNTCYDGDKEDAMYGVAFTAVDENNNTVSAADGATLTVDQMKTALSSALSSESVNAKQVLYFDFGELANVLMNSSEDLTSWKDEMNANCLVFLPSGVSFSFTDKSDNIVRRTTSGDYRAANNIVITDKQPFYSPYNFSVPAENYATYSRKITVDKNGKVTNATIMLPFELAVTDGVHTNPDGNVAFQVSQMNSDDCLTLAEANLSDAKNYVESAKFTPVTGESTKANTPYVVTVTKAPEDANTTFVATQHGSSIAATTSMNATDYTFKGEEANGSINGANYNFVGYASYSGQKLDKKNGYFYFAKNMFLNSNYLKGDYVYVYPFRGYYSYLSSNGAAKSVQSLAVTFGDGTATGIDDITTETADKALTVTTGVGTITVSANQPQNVRIVSTTGAAVDRLAVKAGETRTVNVPAGVYIVNNEKVIVK